MKVIIIGAGIAGLSSYLTLHAYLPPPTHSKNRQKQHQHEIYIYEAHDVSRYLLDDDDSDQSPNGTSTSTSTNSSDAASSSAATTTFTPEAIGSAIGIALNGLAVLARLDDAAAVADEVGARDGEADEASAAAAVRKGNGGRLIDGMLRTGHPVRRWKIGNARGWKLADANMMPERLKGKGGGEGISGVMISRQGMWKILLDEVVRVGGRGVIRKAAVREVLVPGGDRTVASIVLEDGSHESADLIIGADGLRSVVRAAIFPKPADAERPAQSVLTWLLSWIRTPPTGAKDYVTPHYEGLVGVSSFLPSSLLTSTGHEPGAMAITFGPNGFFGHGFISTADPGTSKPLTLSTADPAPQPGHSAVYWSTFPSTNDSWPYHRGSARTKPKPQDFDRAAALEGLVSRHQDWKNPTIQAIVAYAKAHPEKGIEGFYPTWTTPPLPAWHRAGVVLVGDAAHALQPSSGQGACQALEDAEVLARCLQHIVNKDIAGGESINAACEKYEQIRMPRVKEIYDRSQRMSKMKGTMSWFEEMFLYGIIKLMSRLYDGYNERLVGYDVPAEVEKALKHA